MLDAVDLTTQEQINIEQEEGYQRLGLGSVQKIVKNGYLKILSPEMKHYTRLVSYLLHKERNVMVIGSPNSGKSTVLTAVME